MSKYIVTGPTGEYLTALNASLAARQGVTDAELEALKTSHQLRWLIHSAAKVIAAEPQTEARDLKLKMLAQTSSALETEQQVLWHFSTDENFKRFFDFPGCACPRMDNEDRLGTPYKIYSLDCPIHKNLHKWAPQLHGIGFLNGSDC